MKILASVRSKKDSDRKPTKDNVRADAEMSKKSAHHFSRILLFCFFNVSKDEGVVAPRLSSCCTKTRITCARTPVFRVATPAAQTSGEKAPSSL